MQSQYYISVLFTRTPGWVSNLIYWLTGRRYTHASIGLGADADCFYSFDYRGFRTEHPAHRPLKDGQKNSLCYQFQITETEYQKLQAAIEGCLQKKDIFHYNYLGSICCIFHIYLPLKRKYGYFCSEFVSEQLQRLDSFQLKKKACMYLPNSLARDLRRQNNLCQVLVNEI